MDKNDNIKVGDWGLASFRTHSNKLRGTLGSIAPELLTGGETMLYDLEKADVWSLGVLLFTILFGGPPYEAPKVSKNAEDGHCLEPDEFLRMILKKEWKKFWLYQNRFCKKSMNSDLKRLLESMLSVDPNERPTFEEIASHPWLTLVVSSPTSVARDEHLV